MKRAIGVILLVLIVSEGHGQTPDSLRENRSDLVLAANLYGSPSILSLSFEKLFFIKPAFSLTANLGIGFNTEFNLGSNENLQNYTIFPHHITALYGKNKAFLEYGIGGSLVSPKGDPSKYLLYPILGYRYHPFKNSGISFRAWILLPFGQQSTIESFEILFVPFGGSIGIAF